METALYIVGGVVLLALGGETLARNAVAAASRLEVPPFVIGASIVAFGTSVPELVVAVRAALGGHAGFVVGNVVGSNIANVLLALGAAALVHPITTPRSRSTRVDSLVMMGATVIFAIIVLNLSELSRLGGAIFVGTLALATWLTFQRGETLTDIVPDPSRIRSLARTIPLALVSLVVVTVGADLLVEGASQTARVLGVSEVTIGLSVVAVGTSLPEVAVVVAAAFRSQPGLALGSILGSNLFNILGITGVAALASPIGFEEEARAGDITVMLLAALALTAVVVFRVRIPRTMGAVMVALYAGYLVFLYDSAW